jgi:hypothetical protein
MLFYRIGVVFMGKDNRLFPRLDSNTAARVTIQKVNNHDVKLGSRPIVIKDISLSGMQFLCVLKFPVNEDILFEINSPLFGALQGYIVWSKKDGESYCYGINFTSVRSWFYQILNIMR